MTHAIAMPTPSPIFVPELSPPGPEADDEGEVELLPPTEVAVAGPDADADAQVDAGIDPDSDPESDVDGALVMVLTGVIVPKRDDAKEVTEASAATWTPLQNAENDD
ncbi:hypothetical protein VM1G_06531 [Cytospora mali]|uniref:Uncharacterized protein n=1 Tax=Cytospora mali TaxID=578113 RepID=A0A194W0Y2_CYTMA|nr:hypothetical protein VM1G_06531 [Valsa mali]